MQRLNRTDAATRKRQLDAVMGKLPPLARPIDSEGITRFKEWVIWNGWQGRHPGFDFAAYLDRHHRVILGLNGEDVSVRAVEKGVVAGVNKGTKLGRVYDDFYADILIEHCFKGFGFYSSYAHVVPGVTVGQQVKKGQEIAKLYEDERGRVFDLENAFRGNRVEDPFRSFISPTFKRMTHLHFGLAPKDQAHNVPAYFFDPAPFLGLEELPAASSKEAIEFNLEIKGKSYRPQIILKFLV